MPYFRNCSHLIEFDRLQKFANLWKIWIDVPLLFMNKMVMKWPNILWLWPNSPNLYYWGIFPITITWRLVSTLQRWIYIGFFCSAGFALAKLALIWILHWCCFRSGSLCIGLSYTTNIYIGQTYTDVKITLISSLNGLILHWGRLHWY